MDKTLSAILSIIAALFIARCLIGIFGQTLPKNRLTKLLEGKEGPVCKECGSRTYYQERPGATPDSKPFYRAICSNPNCRTHYLDY